MGARSGGYNEQVNNLRCLTLLPFGNALTDDLFNNFRSWCPECLEEWRINNQRVFEPLIWAFRAYSVCAKHNRRLRHTCRCAKTLNPLGTFCRSGHCDHCGVWLGGPRAESGQIADDTVFSEDEKWASSQVVGLVEMLPWIKQDVARASIRQSMNVYLEKLTADNLLAFAESIQCPSSVLRNWLNGVRVPKFDNLLRTSRCLNVSVASLFSPDGPTTANIAAAQDAIASRAERGVSPYRDSDKIRGALLASLRDEVPRTLSDVARSLGYTSTETLYQADRSLCHDIAERYRRSGRSHAWKKPGASRICEIAQLKKVLEETLAMSEPTPLSQVAIGLGYANMGYIQQKFPDLCAAIRKKIIEVKQQKREIMRRVLESAVLETPPPTLSDIACRLGYSTSSVLRAHEPELCDSLAEQYEAHRIKHIADLERDARAALVEIRLHL